MGTKALIDGDVLVYRVGFSCQESFYKVSIYNRHKYCKSTAKFRYIKEAKEHMAAHDGPTDLKAISKVTTTADQAMGRLRTALTNIVAMVGATEYEVFLSHEDPKVNFRYQVDPSYKANRASKDKPLHYDVLREYLINDGASIVEGGEADDLLGITQCNEPNTVICTTDKDLLMIPGLYYNIADQWMTKVDALGTLALEETPGKAAKLRGTGFKWFSAQMLLGDTVDNIKGLKGIGPKRAYQILKNCKTIEDCVLKVSYWYDRYDQIEKYKDNCNLLWILRDVDEFFFDWLDKHADINLLSKGIGGAK